MLHKPPIDLCALPMGVCGNAFNSGLNKKIWRSNFHIKKMGISITSFCFTSLYGIKAANVFIIPQYDYYI